MTPDIPQPLNDRPLAVDMMMVSILNWNGAEDTIACLRGIARQVCPHIQFAVLDNGSQIDPTLELRALFPDVEVFREPHNLGFCGGHNLMIRLAMERGYGSVLILNNDCEIDIHAIVELKKTMDADPQTAVVSPLIYRSGPDRRALMVAGSIDWAQQRSVRPSSPDAVAPAGHPTLIVGTALLLRCAAIERIGLLDDRYFAYYDDNDLSARVAAAGLKAVYCKTSICLHRYKTLHDHSAMALYLMSRNQWLFWQTHTPSAHRGGMTRRLLAQSLHDLALLKKNNSPLEKTNALVAGWWDARRGRFGPPPLKRTSPWLLRRVALIAPYFMSRLLAEPSATLRSTLGRWF